MYQYKAILKSANKVVAENHTLDGIMKDIKHYKREQSRGIHTRGNDEISIYHFHRDGDKKKLIKVVTELDDLKK